MDNIHLGHRVDEVSKKESIVVQLVANHGNFMNGIDHQAF